MKLKYHYIRCDLEDARALLDTSITEDRRMIKALEHLIEVFRLLEHAKNPDKPDPLISSYQHNDPYALSLCLSRMVACWKHHVRIG